MSNLSADARERATMRRGLFAVFISIFAATSVLGIFALFRILVLDFTPPPDSLFERFAWAIWGTVVVEVAATVFALSRNLFGLSEEPTVTTLSNRISEVIDGMESNGLLPPQAADELRSQFEDDVGVSGTVRRVTDK